MRRSGVAIALLLAAGALIASPARAQAAPGLTAMSSSTPEPEAHRPVRLIQEYRALPGPEIVRLAPMAPKPSPAKIAEEDMRQRLDPDAAGPGNPMLEGRRPPGHPAVQGGSGRELRLQMREYGERYGEASRERHENLEAAPSTARWLTDAERFQFREALRERYRQRR